MKKILFIFALCFSYFLNVTAQKQKLEEIFDRYQDTEGVTSIKIAKPMFGMLNKLDIKDSELGQIKPLLSKIQGLKILMIENPGENSEKPAAFYNNLSKEILSSVNKLNYEELVTMNSNGSKVKFLTSESVNGMLDNLLLNITSEGNTILMMLDGKISMEDVNNLVNESQININTESNYTTTSTTTIDSEGEEVENVGNHPLSSGSEERNVGKFTKIDVSTGIKVNFTQSNNQKIKVETEPGKLQHIVTKVENGTLRIYVDNKGKNNLRIGRTLVSVSAPNLDKIRTSAGANFSTLNTVKEDSFDVLVESGSSLQANLQAKNNVNIENTSGSTLKINVETNNLVYNGNSGSSAILTGKAEKANYEVSSAASCNAEKVPVKNAVVSATSGSSLKINVAESLTSQTSSGASVKYAGKPKDITTDNSSGGSTKPINTQVGDDE